MPLCCVVVGIATVEYIIDRISWPVYYVDVLLAGLVRLHCAPVVRRLPHRWRAGGLLAEGEVPPHLGQPQSSAPPATYILHHCLGQRFRWRLASERSLWPNCEDRSTFGKNLSASQPARLQKIAQEKASWWFWRGLAVGFVLNHFKIDY